VALGTLELTLYEQMHLFNVLYDNDLIERPADHQSLVLDGIVLNGDTIPVGDTIKRYHPFADLANLRPTYLGMHKRLVASDGLDAYDIEAPADSMGAKEGEAFDPAVLPLPGPASNFAKSGTTDDVIKPFNATLKSGKKTNYGVWNAVIRIDLSRLGDTRKGAEPEVRDVTVACIGECNEKYTGVRDGKTLHKFLTKGLLLRAGVVSPNGFFTRYEPYIKRTTPSNMMDCFNGTIAGSGEKHNPFEKFLSIFKKKSDTTAIAPPAPSTGDVSKNQD
jgi:hypothetical protein